MSGIIDILDWDITHAELVDWVTENDMDVYAVAASGGSNPRTRYMFQNDDDLLAFKLKFSREQRHAWNKFYPNG
jgi:hypothetical protein